MDDNDKKTIVEKLVDTVKNVTSDIRATNMDPREPNIEAVAEMGNEQMYMPTTDAAAMPLPLAPKKRSASQKADRTELSPDLSGRITPTYEIPLPGPMSPMGNSVRDDRKKAAKKTAPKVAIKTGKKSGKKSAAKKSKEEVETILCVQTR
jgi:hypothetical protein